MKYLGDFIPGQKVAVPWDTFGTDSSSVTCTGGTIYVLSGTGGTETSATSLSESSADIRNFATRTGSHLLFIGTSTLSGGADYLVKLAGATVGPSTINPWLGFFSLRNRSNPTIFGRVLVAATTAGTDEFQLATTGGMFSTTADVYRDAAVVIVEGGGRGQSGVASAYATTNGARAITVDFAGNVAVTASTSFVEVFGQGLFGVTATQVLTATSLPLSANLTQIATVAVAATVAQLGVNVVNITGTAVTTTAAQVGVRVVSVADRAINATNYATGFQPTTTGNLPTNFATLSIDSSGRVTIAGTATGAITASSFGAGAITNTVVATGALTASSFGAGAISGTVLATDAASKVNQYGSVLRSGTAFSNFRFSMLATDGSTFATAQTPSVSLGFGTAARATVAGAVTEIGGGDYMVSFTAGELPAGQTGLFRATATGASTREMFILTTPAT